jgi:hydroxymethylpyrimidine/phosphomethylpyrimidine kinase
MKSVLSIAGSDPSGGAGIQADLKTIAAHGLYGTTVLTALTAQNTTGVQAVHEVPPAFVLAQMTSVFEDIPPGAVKIGMVSSPEIIAVIADQLEILGPRQVVLDPVMIATSGARLLREAAVTLLKHRLIPQATLITPNLPEAEVLWGAPIRSRHEMARAAAKLSTMYPCHILIKGGHLPNACDDLLYMNGTEYWFPQRRIENPNTHGTGCTLSAAIACGLASGLGVCEAVQSAKAYVTGALEAGLNLGRGSGPLDHGWRSKIF